MATEKKQRNNVRINGQNREDAYSSIVRQRKQIETREKAFRIARASSTLANLRTEFCCQQKDRKKKLPWGFYYYFVLCFGAAADYTVWYGRRDRLSIRIAFYICAWLKEEQNERANTKIKKVKEIAGAQFDRINRIWSRAARTGSHNKFDAKWRVHAMRWDAWKWPRSARICLSAAATASKLLCI